jgi:heterodisulfide reductase subunit C2
MASRESDPGSCTDSPAAVPRSAPAPSLIDEIQRLSGFNPARCYQCGKCSAGCPMAGETDLRPHDVLRLVALDRRERLLASESLWLCLGCETCTSRCPNGCDPAAAIDALRAMAYEEAPATVPRPLAAFHRSFLEEIRAHGRLSELGLMVRYKLRSGALFQDATSGPGMVARGKLHLKPPKIQGVEQVRAIFRACEEEEA